MDKKDVEKWKKGRVNLNIPFTYKEHAWLKEVKNENLELKKKLDPNFKGELTWDRFFIEVTNNEAIRLEKVKEEMNGNLG